MKILVIGDSCIDIFKYGKVTRIAPEAPVPVIVIVPCGRMVSVNPGVQRNRAPIVTGPS